MCVTKLHILTLLFSIFLAPRTWQDRVASYWTAAWFLGPYWSRSSQTWTIWVAIWTGISQHSLFVIKWRKSSLLWGAGTLFWGSVNRFAIQYFIMETFIEWNLAVIKWPEVVRVLYLSCCQSVTRHWTGIECVSLPWALASMVCILLCRPTLRFFTTSASRKRSFFFWEQRV